MTNKAVAAIGAGLLLAGVFIGRASATDKTPAAKPAPITTQGLDPKAFPHTKNGAVTAAQAYSDALGRALFVDAAERRQVIATVSTDAMRDEIVKEQDEAAEGGAKLLDLAKDPDQLVARIAPLGYRLASYTEQTARIEVWSVGVVGKPGVGHGPAVGFNNTLYDLSWERDAWRLAGSPDVKDGPAPIPDDPVAATAFAASVKDLKEFDHVAR